MEKYSSLTLTLIKFEKGEEICLCKTSDVKKFGNDTISKGFVIKENGEVGQIKSIYKEEMNKFLATQKFSTPIETVKALKVEDIWNSQKIKISEVKNKYCDPDVKCWPYPKITTKQELVKLIKRDFRDEDGVIDLSNLDFSGEEVNTGKMKVKELYQNYQEVEGSLHQSKQKVGRILYQYNQEVGLDLHQYSQKVKGKKYD